jgi:hypothetical protein
MKAVVNSFEVSPEGTHFGAVVYSASASKPFTFPQFFAPGSQYSNEYVEDLIDKIPRERGLQRNAYIGLQTAFDLFTKPFGGRQDARKVLGVVCLFVYLFVCLFVYFNYKIYIVN